jgi:hypothetical protein
VVQRLLRHRRSGGDREPDRDPKALPFSEHAGAVFKIGSSERAVRRPGAKESR